MVYKNAAGKIAWESTKLPEPKRPLALPQQRLVVGKVAKIGNGTGIGPRSLIARLQGGSDYQIHGDVLAKGEVGCRDLSISGACWRTDQEIQVGEVTNGQRPCCKRRFVGSATSFVTFRLVIFSVLFKIAAMLPAELSVRENIASVVSELA